MSTVSMICVEDVETTSQLLQELFGWTSSHGGKEFDDLVDKNNRSVLWLHHLESEPHPRFRSAKNNKCGVGSTLYVLVDDIEERYGACKDAEVEIIEELYLNTNAQFREFTIKIKDGFQFSVCEKGPHLKI